MENKAINPLGLVFTIFILIIASLVVITMLQNVNITPLTKVFNDFSSTYQYDSALANCRNKCDKYLTTSETKSAVDFCLAKAGVDFTGNNKVDKGAGAVVQAIPFCEDGVYCFHIYPECVGGQKLDAKTCKSILCRYYQEVWGYDAITAMKAIKGEITFGTCDSTAIKNDATGKKADDWWKDAGYSATKC